MLTRVGQVPKLPELLADQRSPEQASQANSIVPRATRSDGDRLVGVLYIYDFVLEHIDECVGAHPPERGGALVGPIGKHCITDFVFDDGARVGAAQFEPSVDLGRVVQQRELQAPCEFKGILHSHPGDFSRLSAQDHVSIGNALAANPHLARFTAPVVTTAIAHASLEAHQLLTEHATISFFNACRTRNGDTAIMTERVTVVPIQRDLGRLTELYGASRPHCFLHDFGGAEVVAGRLVLPGDVELLFLFSELYPGFAPILLLTLEEGEHSRCSSRGHSTFRLRIDSWRQ